ncbi:DUF2179 domain-containing protein [bacterium]|nr:DUF2179 domain-containing protein [bacterium]
MVLPEWAQGDLFRWVLLPVMIFLARIADVSLQTLRILFVSRANRILAPLLGFFEVLIWILVIGQIMQNLDNALCYIAYALGFAAGTWVGIVIEDKLAYGQRVLRIITQAESADLIRNLRQQGFGVTVMEANGARGKVQVIDTVVRRADLHRVSKMIKRHHPKAFYSVEDIRSVSAGVFPLRKQLFTRKYIKRKSLFGRLKFYIRWMFRRP